MLRSAHWRKSKPHKASNLVVDKGGQFRLPFPRKGIAWKNLAGSC